MAQALRGIELGSPVQQSTVVEHHQLPGIQKKADLKVRRAQTVVKEPPCAEVRLEPLRGKKRHQIQARTEMDRLQGSGDIQFNRRRAGGELRVSIDVPEAYRRAGENLEGLR